MKHFFFLAIAFLIITSTVQAQNLYIGIKGGVNGYTIRGDNSDGFEPKNSYNVGLLGHIHMNRVFAIQPEVVYSVQGTQYKIGNANVHLDLTYVNIPLLFQYMFDNGFRLEAGPQLGVLRSAKLVNGDANTDQKANYKSTDIGLAVGMSYVKPATGFGINIRYNHGFTDINENVDLNSYNRGVQLGIFYLFNHRY